MATPLYLRNTEDASPNVDLAVIGVDRVFDMLTTAGAAADTAVVRTVASGTEILLTLTDGGQTVAWITGRTPAGGFALTTTDIEDWWRESNMNANAGGRFRVYRYTPGTPATLTELGGGPFNDGVEFSTSDTQMAWIGNVTDQAFAEDERIVLKLFITNIGTMGGNFLCTHTFNAAAAATGDSLFNLAQTVTFKAEPVAYALNLEPDSYAISGQAAEVLVGRAINAEAGNYDISGSAADLAKGTPLNADPGAYTLTGLAAALTADRQLGADPATYELVGQAASLLRGYVLSAEFGSYVLVGADATLEAPAGLQHYTLNAESGSYGVTGRAADLTVATSALQPAGTQTRWPRRADAPMRTQRYAFTGLITIDAPIPLADMIFTGVDDELLDRLLDQLVTESQT